MARTLRPLSHNLRRMHHLFYYRLRCIFVEHIPTRLFTVPLRTTSTYPRVWTGIMLYKGYTFASKTIIQGPLRPLRIQLHSKVLTNRPRRLLTVPIDWPNQGFHLVLLKALILSMSQVLQAPHYFGSDS
ncbi:hypothetical protein Salat_0212800 [Sesamum alatum]|uniref:Uncharacterized protein n=1 Tax=Sesamum alatum TaxID=300844 RepID=A0AAE2CY21_9LAMI|nr:hypothetical protein Salat_0212800 [Sesamum alatum]